MENIKRIDVFDPNGQLPGPERIIGSPEYAISPSLPGNLYEITQVFDSAGNIYAVKTLKPGVAKSGRYPSDFSLEDIFTVHMAENAIFRKHLAEFMLPEYFYVTQAESNITCRIIQPWVTGVQFKEAVTNNRSVPDRQMPDLPQRLRFVKGVASLLTDENVFPRISDLDFFLTDSGKRASIKLIDTNFLWYPKLASDSRKRFYDLTRFLFTEEEQKIPEVSETIEILQKAFNLGQLDN